MMSLGRVGSHNCGDLAGCGWRSVNARPAQLLTEDRRENIVALFMKELFFWRYYHCIVFYISKSVAKFEKE